MSQRTLFDFGIGKPKQQREQEAEQQQEAASGSGGEQEAPGATGAQSAQQAAAVGNGSQQNSDSLPTSILYLDAEGTSPAASSHFTRETAPFHSAFEYWKAALGEKAKVTGKESRGRYGL